MVLIIAASYIYLSSLGPRYGGFRIADYFFCVIRLTVACHQPGIRFAWFNGKRGTGVSRYAPQTRISSLLRIYWAGLGDRRVRQHGVAHFGGNCGRRLALVGESCGQTRNVRFTPERGHDNP